MHRVRVRVRVEIMGLIMTRPGCDS
eukprot:COSAG01_NODE_17719_length_1129_cov_1.557282_1_plen_24_part_10